jgi:hypothetical protein
LLGQWGVSTFPWVLLVLLLVSLCIASQAREHGFAQGDRQSGQVVEP